MVLDQVAVKSKDGVGDNGEKKVNNKLCCCIASDMKVCGKERKNHHQYVHANDALITERTHVLILKKKNPHLHTVKHFTHI